MASGLNGLKAGSLRNLKMINVGLIGFGKMAMAIVQGWKTAGMLNESVKAWAYAPTWSKLEANCATLQATPCHTPGEVCDHSEVLILACKPYQVEEVLKSLQPAALEGKLVVCVAAGINFEKLEAWLPERVHHVSIMPNTAMAAAAGIVIEEQNNTMDEADRKVFERLFSPLALIEPIAPKDFSIAGTIAGCSPAFLGLYAEALADAGVKYGLSRPVAARLAARAVYGAGAMLIEEGKEPSVFKNEICSPGGTTIKGIVTLEKDGFRKAVIEAIEAIEG